MPSYLVIETPVLPIIAVTSREEIVLPKSLPQEDPSLSSQIPTGYALRKPSVTPATTLYLTIEASNQPAIATLRLAIEASPALSI